MKNKINKKKHTISFTFRRTNGFTLIELIVVVTIIAVLTVVGVVSYNGTNKRARDSRRITDLESIRVALELYRQGLGSTYPADGTLRTKLKPNYITDIPVDPKSKLDYSYDQTGTGYTYTLRAVVEDLGSTNMAGNIYQVTNP